MNFYYYFPVSFTWVLVMENNGALSLPSHLQRSQCLLAFFTYNLYLPKYLLNL